MQIKIKIIFCDTKFKNSDNPPVFKCTCESIHKLSNNLNNYYLMKFNMSKFINGPINYVELTGTINGIEKHITFFMDYHYTIYKQTRCESFDSIDISQYLYKIIKQSTCPLDFFLEIRMEEILNPTGNKRDIYIREVIEMFKSELIIEKQFDRNFVRYAKSNQNVRLHWLDMRDNFNMFKLMKIIDKKIKPNLKLLMETENVEYKNKAIEYLERIKINITNLKTNLNDVLTNTSTITYNKIEQKEKYYMNKIINQIANQELKKSIREFTTGYFNRLFQIFEMLMSELDSLLINFKPQDTEQTIKLVDFLHEMIIDLHSIFTDVFLLRRILDKNYINKAIVYSEAQHAINSIGFLVKFCDFKIVNVHLSEIKSMDELMDIIKKSEHVYNIYKYFYQKNKEYTQCVKYDEYILNMLPNGCK